MLKILRLFLVPCFFWSFVAFATPDSLNRYFSEVPSAWKGHKPFAEWLVKEMNPKQIVDLGVDYGFSTFVFANVAPRDCVITGIDLFEGDVNAGLRDTYTAVLGFARDFSFPNVEIIRGNFQEVARLWNRPVDILHIDGFHSYEAVRNDYNSWAHFVHNDGVILFHDVNVAHFGVIDFFKEVNHGHKLYFLHTFGLGILTRNEKLYQAMKANFQEIYDFSVIPLIRH